MYSDLEVNSLYRPVSFADVDSVQCDYINPIDLCNKLNIYIVPEMVPASSLSEPVLFISETLTMALGSPCVPDITFPYEWVLASSLAQYPPRCMERKQVTLQILIGWLTFV